MKLSDYESQKEKYNFIKKSILYDVTSDYATRINYQFLRNFVQNRHSATVPLWNLMRIFLRFCNLDPTNHFRGCTIPRNSYHQLSLCGIVSIQE